MQLFGQILILSYRDAFVNHFVSLFAEYYGVTDAFESREPNTSAVRQQKVHLKVRSTYLLLCPSFNVQERRDLLAGIVELTLLFLQIINLSKYALMQLLLYGDQYLSYDWNRNNSNRPCVSFTKLVRLTEICRNFSYVQSSH